jgi:hypothetical protein
MPAALALATGVIFEMRIEQLRSVKKFLDPYLEIEEDDQFESELEKISDPDCIHILISEINWDCGAECIQKILRKPECDFSTVLLAYWMNSPGFWVLKGHQDIENYETPSFELHKYLESKICYDSEQRGTIEFNPKSDRGIDWVAPLKPNALKAIPENAFVPQVGRKAEVQDWEKI